jgi:hypothetical protein
VNRRNGWRLLWPVVAVGCILGVTACVASVADGNHVGQQVKKGGVLLVPNISAGSVGWCVIRSNEGTCPGTARWPVLFEAWRDSEGYAVVSKGVYAVSVDGGAPIKMTNGGTLEGGLRSIAVRLHGLDKALRSGFVAVDHDGRRVPNALSGRRLFFEVATRSAGQSSGGKCKIYARPDAPKAEGARVVTESVAPGRLVSPGFLTCASAQFQLKGYTLYAGVLTGVADERTLPALPDMRAIPHVAGLYKIVAFEGEAIARQAAGHRGWLVVSGGKPGLRIHLIERLSASVKA